jgi:hypothetical protein
VSSGRSSVHSSSTGFEALRNLAKIATTAALEGSATNEFWLNSNDPIRGVKVCTAITGLSTNGPAVSSSFSMSESLKELLLSTAADLCTDSPVSAVATELGVATDDVGVMSVGTVLADKVDVRCDSNEVPADEPSLDNWPDPLEPDPDDGWKWLGSWGRSTDVLDRRTARTPLEVTVKTGSVVGSSLAAIWSSSPIRSQACWIIGINVRKSHGGLGRMLTDSEKVPQDLVQL